MMHDTHFTRNEVYCLQAALCEASLSIVDEHMTFSNKANKVHKRSCLSGHGQIMLMTPDEW